ncbi:disease resistance protein RPV1 [Hevea brasiliensis]|uniref:disease resistance protein RPV1 n=1 Tax=Hevea brasiliensis TaxID=3981 RepID=UPI0025F25376|nr:disease resistance protein RPV1 [Hevea brasiliensis]
MNTVLYTKPSNMASSSSSSSSKHDVFLSFRGKATRYNFTSHVYGNLCEKGIRTFMDDRLERGEEIEPAIIKAIKEAEVSVIIFSNNYADSPWCLDELVMILKCRDEQLQDVIPVFYHVDPDDVREQKNSFGEALAKHKRHFQGNPDKVQKWRTALTKAANIDGKDLTEAT